MTITEFLEARIAEDEAQAQSAKDWVANGPEPRYPWFGSHGEVTGKRFGIALPHIATMSPSRVLAECAAKRAIINLADATLRENADRRDASALGAELMHDEVLCALAAVYATHPDYQQEWAL